MSYNTFQPGRYQMLPEMTKYLLVINGLMYLATYVLSNTPLRPFFESLALYRLPEKSTPSAVVSPRKLKPVNRNDNYRVFPLSGARPRVLQIDHRGNLWLLEIRPRRWVKTALYAVE